MKTKLLLMLAAVAILAMAIGQAQAITVEVPNGDFDTLYKPGTDGTVTASLDSGEWFKANVGNQGVNCALQQGGIADYSDGTTGTAVDFPSWTFLEGSSDVMMGGAWGGPDGSVAISVFTGWGGTTQVTSAEPLNAPPGPLRGSLSADVYHDGRPVYLDLTVDGEKVPPTTATDPPGVASQWVVFTRTYDFIPAGELKILFGTIDDPGETGQRASIDNITLDVESIGATNPSPPDGATVPVGDVDLSWTNLDPNVGDITYVDVWFGTEPNELHPGYDMVKVVTAGENTNTWTVSAPTAGTYYWQVVNYIYGPDKIDEPNALAGPPWSFIAVEDLAPTIVIDTADMMTWSGEPVPLDATVTDDGVSALTYAWSANPPDGVVFTPSAAVEDPTVTITKATDNPSTVTLTVAVSDVGNPTPNTDTMEIDVYDDACQLVRIALGLSAITDFDNNCITDVKDLAAMLAQWLADYKATAPAPRP